MNEDLSKMIQNILSSDEGREQLQSMADMLGMGDQLDLPPQEAPPPEPEPQQGGIPGLGDLDINMILKLQQMMGQMNHNDKNTQLIAALKPHLRPERQEKADEAIRMMRMLSMLPLLGEGGLGGLFSDKNK